MTKMAAEMLVAHSQVGETQDNVRELRDFVVRVHSSASKQRPQITSHPLQSGCSHSQAFQEAGIASAVIGKEASQKLPLLSQDRPGVAESC